MRKLFLAGSLAVGIVGCSPPPLQFVPANVAASQHKLDAALISTVVTVAPKGEATGKVDIAGSEADVTELWKSALDDTLLRMAVFRDSSPRRLTLTVKILKLRKTGVLGFGVESAARYHFLTATPARSSTRKTSRRSAVLRITLASIGSERP